MSNCICPQPHNPTYPHTPHCNIQNQTLTPELIKQIQEMTKQ